MDNFWDVVDKLLKVMLKAGKAKYERQVHPHTTVYPNSHDSALTGRATTGLLTADRATYGVGLLVS